jgi:hypothetical protein
MSEPAKKEELAIPAFYHQLGKPPLPVSIRKVNADDTVDISRRGGTEIIVAAVPVADAPAVGYVTKDETSATAKAVAKPAKAAKIPTMSGKPAKPAETPATGDETENETGNETGEGDEAGDKNEAPASGSPAAE